MLAADGAADALRRRDLGKKTSKRVCEPGPSRFGNQQFVDPVPSLPVLPE